MQKGKSKKRWRLKQKAEIMNEMIYIPLLLYKNTMLRLSAEDVRKTNYNEALLKLEAVSQ